MAATIGPNDLDIYESPRPSLLREITGLPPVVKGTHVMLEGAHSLQRLAVGEVGGNVWLAMWPAELKEHALYLYGGGLAEPMVRTAESHGWRTEPAPQIAFRSSAARLRLYLRPAVDTHEYVRRWEQDDLDRIGAYPRKDVRAELWPWLKERGYAAADDDPVLEEWLESCLGKRKAFLRAGLRLMRRSEPADSSAQLRQEVNAILAAAGEPALPR